MAQSPAKKQKTGSMPPEMKAEIEQALELFGEVERYRRPHRKGAGPMQAKILPPEDLVHEKSETLRQGSANRIHYKCSNEKCQGQMIRSAKVQTLRIKIFARVRTFDAATETYNVRSIELPTDATDWWHGRLHFVSKD